jgi:tetratricopeptide (TPR) repeat protein
LRHEHDRDAFIAAGRRVSSVRKLHATFAEACALHRQGQLARARALYRKVLEVQPRHFDALNLLGVLAGQTGDPKRAVTLFDRAIQAQPDQAAPHCNRGLALQELKEWTAALASFDAAIVRQPDHAIAYYNRGNVLRELAQPQAALASYEQALAFNPQFPQAHYNRGVVLQSLGQLEAALAAYARALELAPESVDALYNSGIIHNDCERFEAAVASFDAALARQPDQPRAYLNRGVALARLGRFEAALASYDRAIASSGDYAAAHSNRGDVLVELGRYDEAVDACRRALVPEPDFADAHYNLAVALHALDRLEEALESYTRTIALRPDHVRALTNRGNVLRSLRRLDAAFESFDAALAIDSHLAEAHFNRATTRLLTGEFARGWEEYEWRWQVTTGHNPTERRRFSQPLWLGDAALAGRTILLHGEQGLGDIIQFSRYVERVCELGATVILEVRAPVAGLLSGLGAAQIVTAGSALPDFDCHCPLMSLPLAFKTELSTIPWSGPYLRADPERLGRWRTRLGAPGKHIGLVWSGNALNPNNAWRSVPLGVLLQHLPPDFHYYSLSTEMSVADRSIVDANPRISALAEDFVDTAAICAALDLVISIDTSIAHLSGALGHPTWLLLAHSPDWRWLLDRDDSPWYPSMRLYRQPSRGDWHSVLARVAGDLTRWAGSG